MINLFTYVIISLYYTKKNKKNHKFKLINFSLNCVIKKI